MDTPHAVPLSISQAADCARVSPKTIRRWIAAGRLRARRVGRAYVVDPADLEGAVGKTRPEVVRGIPTHDQAVTMSASIFIELTECLDAQATELAALRLERDELADRLRTITHGDDTAPYSQHDAERQEPRNAQG